MAEQSSESVPASTSSEADEHKRRVADLFGGLAPAYGTVGDFFDYFGRRLAERARLKPGMHVLDVAAGKGASAFPAAELVGPTGHVLAVDLTSQMVQHLRAEATRTGALNVECAVMDGEHLQVDDHSFDAVLCGFGLFFFHDPRKGALEFRRVVRPGGTVACSMPMTTFPPYLMALRREFEQKAGGPPTPGPDPNFDGAGILREAGFEDVVTEDEEIERVFASGAHVAEFALATGARGMLDRLSPADAAEAERRMTADAPPGPIRQTMSARFWVASG